MRAIDVIRAAKDIYMSGKEKCMCWAFHEAINTGWAYEKRISPYSVTLLQSVDLARMELVGYK